MNNEIYFAIGILSAFVYFICLAVILIVIMGKRTEIKIVKSGQKEPVTIQDTISLATLRMKLDNIQGDLGAAQRQMWEYGIENEEKGKRWRMACMAIAGKSVAAMQSCYLLSETDKTAKDIYDEMLSSLRTVGVMEIRPKDGDTWDEADLRLRIRNKKGDAPYHVCKLVYPGYKFIPSVTDAPDPANEIVLEPAYVDLQGK